MSTEEFAAARYRMHDARRRLAFEAYGQINYDPRGTPIWSPGNPRGRKVEELKSAYREATQEYIALLSQVRAVS